MKTEDAVKQFLTNRSVSCRSKTLTWYGWILSDFATACTELPVTPEPIESFLSSSPGDDTRSGRFRALRTLYNFICPHCGSRHLRRRKTSASVEVCGSCGQRNPMEVVGTPRKTNKVMRTFSTDQLRRLFGQPLSLRDRTLLTLFLDNGIREGEAASLTWGNISCNSILVCGKSGERAVPILPETGHLLGQLKAEAGPHGAVFKGLRGPLTESGIYQIVHKACGAAGITGKRASPHTLRHTSATLMITAGCDLETIRQILGHSSVAVTQRYLHQNLTPVIKKHRVFSPLKAVQAAAQGGLFDADETIKEAEDILLKPKEVFCHVGTTRAILAGHDRHRGVVALPYP